MKKKAKKLLDARDNLLKTKLVGQAQGFVSATTSKIFKRCPSSYYQGWEGNAEENYFNRKPFEVEKPTYKVIGQLSRRDQFDAPSDRHNLIRKYNYQENGLNNPESLIEPLKHYYNKYPEKLKADKALYNNVIPARKEDEDKIGHRYILAAACEKGWQSTPFAKIDRPEVSDWDGVRERPFNIKDPVKMKALIKRIARYYGAAIVGVTKLNPLWVYERSVGARGYEPGEKIEIPKWWVNAIVIGVPHYWDTMYANPTYGIRGDATISASIAAARLEVFIRDLGYATRLHGPDHIRGEVIMPPLMIDAGLGQQGRFSYTITPEFGANVRTAIVTTNLPLDSDQPIDIGLSEFCKVCKLCAEVCPANAISMEDQPGPLRDSGFEGWSINWETCLLYRESVPSSKRCRLCLTVCPWTRKSNWIHNGVKNILLKDPTGIAKYPIIWGAKHIYEMPNKKSYRRPEWGSFRKPPWFFKSEEYLDL